jgi:uncharacterized protein (TIGR02266 family)
VTSRALQTDPTVVPGKIRRRARAYQRAAVRCGCWLEHEEATVYGTTIDLGQGGLFLRTALPMTPGSDVTVTLKLPGHQAVVAEGQVVRRVAPADGDRPGVGVRFDKLACGDESLAAFLGVTLEDPEAAFDEPVVLRDSDVFETE